MHICKFVSHLNHPSDYEVVQTAVPYVGSTLDFATEHHTFATVLYRHRLLCVARAGLARGRRRSDVLPGKID